MTGIHNKLLSDALGPLTPARRSVTGSHTDHRHSKTRQQPRFFAKVAPGNEPRDATVVSPGCRVVYSIGSGAVRTGLLVDGARTGSDIGVIAVSSILGATLIGMHVGERATSACEDGTTTSLKVLAIENAGPRPA
ncbi:GreA/GreB family elongation factor [Oceaniglobus indicus]|uniref:GreA/GreB family elongation factor n=1 Tax=Oceaniglobus indicus TaxID=2047749 RepID=UPI000C194FA1|nr:GreA/GreB family elongation factor [Oceaniglobus indicus]